MQNTIPYRYYNIIRNCGDAITAYILREVFDVTGRVVHGGEPHMLSVGSIFFMANRNSHIWGSGVLSPNMHIPEIDPRNISALRGKKSVAHLRSLGYGIPDVPLGDPGILVSEFVKPARVAKYKAAIIPHHSGFHSERWRFARESAEVCLVDMMDDTLLPLEQIAESEVVLSQSLHGLIFAAALGKPYLWISGQSSETWNWKFLDWFSTCDNPQESPVLLGMPFEDMIKAAELRPCTSSLDDLKAAFPVGLIERNGRTTEDFETARKMSPAQIFYDGALFDENGDAPASAGKFIELVRRVRSTVFRGVPEPTYLAILSSASAVRPRRTDLLAGQRYLDEHRDAQFVWYPDTPNEAGTRKFVKGTGDLKTGGLKGGSVLLRPSEYLTPNAEYVVFDKETA